LRRQHRVRRRVTEDRLFDYFQGRCNLRQIPGLIRLLDFFAGDVQLIENDAEVPVLRTVEPEARLLHLRPVLGYQLAKLCLLSGLNVGAYRRR
jgi:hypothetical protein